MLKITRTSGSEMVVLRFEGKLVGPWVDEAVKEVQQALELSKCVDLDLAQLTFVDLAGAKFLREGLPTGVRIAACSRFVAELLRLERSSW